MSEKVLQFEKQLDTKKSIWAWALYDWANSSFATTVMAGFFPVFLGSFWAARLIPKDRTLILGVGNSIASLLIVILAPILGAIADRMAGKKRFLGAFALLGATMTIALAFLSYGQYLFAVTFYALGTIGFSGANVFYDSLLTGVASEKKVDFTSSLGFSMGYIGGGLLFTFNVIMYLFPDVFGLKNANQAIQWSFISVGIWWIIFSIPIFLNVMEPPVPQEVGYKKAVQQGFTQLKNTFKEVRHLKYVFLFLLAYWLYIDGVDTIIRMALNYGQSLADDPNSGFVLRDEDLVIMLLMVQFVAFPGTLLYNYFSQKIGIKNGILVAILGYCGITIFGYFISQPWHFYVIGAIVGLFQGGIQALSRSLYSRLIPKTKAAEFYGFFGMWGKFAAVIGPALMGVVTTLTDIRTGILSILVLFVLGGGILFFVDIEAGQEMARKYLSDIKIDEVKASTESEKLDKIYDEWHNEEDSEKS